MSASMLNRADAIRRRMRVAHRVAAANGSVHVAVCPLSAQTIGAFDDFRRTRIHAIALAVLAVHCAVALKAWRLSPLEQRPRVPPVMELQFDVRAVEPKPATNAPQTAGLSKGLAQAVARPAPHPSIPHRSARDMASVKSAPRASDPGSLASTTAKNTSTVRPARATTQPTAASTDPGTPDASATRAQDSQSIAEPLIEPSFGAAYLHNPPPAYPSVAQQRGWQGTVLLRVHVLANGRPDHVGLASSSGHASLDDAALEAVTCWRFAPAHRGDQAIDGWVQVPIDFKLGT